jgi:CRISPR-associated protein Csb3
MNNPEPTIRVPLEPTNPGQFFACCGLLELAYRLWPTADGWFAKGEFCLRPNEATKSGNAVRLLDQLASCVLTNTMTAEQLSRLDELSEMTGSVRAKGQGLDDEKKALEKLRREEPILLQAPFNLRLDWFQDDRAGGSRFKTWAGQQSVLDIALSMKRALEASDWRTRPPSEWLSRTVSGCGLPFNFDSDLGGQGSALDVGFSFDPLAGSALTRIASSARPCLELLAFIGLQRFRPRQLMNDNRFLYCTWNRPLTPEIAAPAACGVIPVADAPTFEFRLLYRTKYLKSFLPAIPFSGGSDE